MRDDRTCSSKIASCWALNEKPTFPWVFFVRSKPEEDLHRTDQSRVVSLLIRVVA